jgi:uncharacterized protein (DUF2147 family)
MQQEPPNGAKAARGWRKNMAVTLIAIAMAAAVMPPESAVGRWKTETKNGIVEIARCGTSLCGTLVTSDGIAANPNLADTNNKETSLRGRKLKGLQMLNGFKYADGVWDGGNIYNAEDGKTYGARITMVDANTLKLRGCIFVPLCKNQIWRRVR